MRRKAHKNYILQFASTATRNEAVNYGKELGSILLRHRIKKISEFSFHTIFRIHSVFKTFHSEESFQKVAESYAGFNGYVWTITVSGKKKLLIKISGYVWTWSEKSTKDCNTGIIVLFSSYLLFYQ